MARKHLYKGDCLSQLKKLPDCSIDSIVTDPPYELGFMGKQWDASGIAYNVELWTEALRVLKPGGHLLAFGGTRTYHRMACAIEDAGFEIRDSIHWIYGSGFPKSLDVSKAVDKNDAAAMRRKRDLCFTAWMRSTGITSAEINRLTDSNMGGHYLTAKEQPAVATAEMFDMLRPHLPEVPDEIEEMVRQRTIESENFKRREVTGHHEQPAPAQQWMANYDMPADLTPKERRDKAHTSEAQQWQGWGTALKPAHEPIVVARKPFASTVAANVLEHGTGALNIDGCRVGTEVRTNDGMSSLGVMHDDDWQPGKVSSTVSGRWPANIVFDEDAAAELDAQSGVSKSTAQTRKNNASTSVARGAMTDFETGGYGDTGGASRFFYCAKASRKERNAGLDGLPQKTNKFGNQKNGDDIGNGSVNDKFTTAPAANSHPTVKPIALMRWLVRLVTPPGGVVLDPFLGSGTTAVAAILEGFDWKGCEMTEDYWPIIEARVKWARSEVKKGKQGELF